MRNKPVFEVNGKQHTLGQKTWFMGVINVTPDSLSDPGEYLDKDKAIAKGLELEKQGADILDIGGESSRPGSNPVSERDELKRIIPVIEELRKRTKILISVDTTKAKVAEEALAAWVAFFNLDTHHRTRAKRARSSICPGPSAKSGTKSYGLMKYNKAISQGRYFLIIEVSKPKGHASSARFMSCRRKDLCMTAVIRKLWEPMVQHEKKVAMPERMINYSNTGMNCRSLNC